MRYMMQSGGYSGGMGSRDGSGSESYGRDGGRYEARRLPPRNRYGEFRRRRRREFNEDHMGYGYDDMDMDEGMGRRRYREDDWQTQGFVDPERERRYYDDEDDRERRRERRRRREREYYGDDGDDGYD